MPGKNLTREEAAARAQLLRLRRYEVTLDLTTSETTFETTTSVTFDATDPGAETFIDFIGEAVHTVVLNGRRLDHDKLYDGARVRIPHLAASNHLLIEATGVYMNTGEGLHRFVDPVDQEVYLYTQFEVADCRRMFPVFEQPDLKAAFAFTVTAPANWQIISNEPTPTPIPRGLRQIPGRPAPVEVATWAFAPTPPLPCYITALIAGSYDVMRDSVVTGAKEVPLGVYCRRSLTPYLDADNVLDCTKRGFAFFEKEFGVPYPFDKYDQVFTPEYNMGAMENAGAVTFNETYVFRAKVPQALVERRGLTILHELAHMWFGNLVTMHWWDDLWLNESFAEWASTTCQTEATQWRSAWTTFAIAEKAWAYAQDQLSSTHPIVANIRTLEDVQVNFDGITYAKGASVLKQLVAYVGREAFTNGLRAYFLRHAWSNTTLADLLRELEATSGRELTSWSKDWLETAGVNTLSARVETTDDGIITSAVVEQTATEEYPVLRPHRLGIGLYEVDGDGLRRRRFIETDIAGAVTPIPELIGEHRPAVLLVNDEDLAYAKIRLDGPSLDAARTHLSGDVDSLPRALILGAAWDMTRDAESSASDFVAISASALARIEDSTMLRVLLGQVSVAATLYTAPARRDAVVTDLALTLRELTERAQPGSDAQLQFITAFSQLARSQEDLGWLAGLLAGSQKLPGLAVDTEMRWTLVTSLAAGGWFARAEIDAEQERDNTSTGRERAARALASRPTEEAKQEAWRAAVETDGLPNQMVEAIGQGFNRVHDVTLLQPFLDRYHDALSDVWASRTHAIAEGIVEGFYPIRLADSALLECTQAWLTEHPDAPAGLRRLVSENRDRVQRALAAQARDAQGL